LIFNGKHYDKWLIAYVSNVVYSCGCLLRERQLIIPYAMSDFATTFATIPLDDILTAIDKT
jgi:predicted GH43/DUF377 family glycosyl hydrolase